MDSNIKFYIEYNLTDKCNLNCKACAAFSPLVNENNSKSLLKIEKDFEKIYDLSFQGERIERVTIMGGEPLLHHDINGAITYISNLFKNSEICIVTNGTLILKKDDEFFYTLKKYISTVFITRYPINIDYEKIYSLLKEKGINYKLYGPENGKDKFYHQYLKNEYNEDYENVECWYRSLLILRDNKIFPCTEIAYFDYFDKAFKGQHDLKVREQDYIDLDNIHSLEELYEAKKIIPGFCGYCMGNNKSTTDWGISEKNINEWIKNN